MRQFVFIGRNDITSGFRLPGRANHNGGDIVGRESKEIHPIEGGKIIQSRIVTNKNDRTWEWGFYCSILGEETGDTWFYCHQERQPFFSPGQKVTTDSVIGYMGNTGYSTGPHLHLERGGR